MIDIVTYIMIHAPTKLLQVLYALGLCTKMLLDQQVLIEEFCTQQLL